jgi:hypothetical protein
MVYFNGLFYSGPLMFFDLSGKNNGSELMNISKRYIVDENGNLRDVVIPIADYKKIEEILGLDLGDEAEKQLREARQDREIGNKDAYIDLDAI